ncbi:MAG TPA: hypothetical protein VM537_28740 [Anaerolineae bacterium]|nr:hypothetical protein [Anaerolineae bacterium]
MVGSGRTVGFILIALAVIVFLVTASLMVAQRLGGDTSIGGAVLGVALMTIFVALPLAAAGVWFYTRGRREVGEFAEVEKQKKLLNVIVTQGQLSVAEMALELDATRDQVKEWIYDLVGKGLFSGYVNWEDGMLYSRQASQMRDAQVCPTCGAQLELAGKGVITCPYCGVDIFLAT